MIRTFNNKKLSDFEMVSLKSNKELQTSREIFSLSTNCVLKSSEIQSHFWCSHCFSNFKLLWLTIRCSRLDILRMLWNWKCWCMWKYHIYQNVASVHFLIQFTKRGVFCSWCNFHLKPWQTSDYWGIRW